MEINSLHLIRGIENDVVFHNRTLSLIKVSKNAGEILHLMQTDQKIDIVSKKTNCSIEDIEMLLSSLFNIIGKNSQNVTINKRTRRITRITLHVSNDCNLRCKYCYADGGNYQQAKGMMSLKTADDFLKFCINTFEFIDNIVFFGGEPCMNINIIEYICAKFRKFEEIGLIKYHQKFTIITNGTILSKRIIDIIDKYISYVTVSIDGNKFLNDSNRVFGNGKGSYDKIETFIKTVKSKTKVDLRYEATYTRFHQEHGASIESIASYLEKNFQIKGSVIPELSMRTVARDIVHNNHNIQDFNSFPESFFNTLKSIVLKKPSNSCLIGTKQFAVSVDGLIYPCHMDVSIVENNLGSINGQNIFNDNRIQQSFPLTRMLLDKQILCKHCWANTLCDACTRSIFYDDKKKKYNHNQNESICNSIRKQVEEDLLEIACLRSDNDKWNLLMSHQKIAQ